MGDRVFYVYEHWRPDKDVCFYVGKGQGRRARVMYARKNYHANIQKKLARLGMCVEIRMVQSGMTEEDAYALEIERIAMWRSMGVKLANRNDGGEGGANPAPETRAKMRDAKLGRKLTEEHKRKIGEASRRTQNDPEVKARRVASAAIAFATPEYKAKQSKSQREKPRTKERYEKIAAALRGRKISPGHAEKVRQANLGRKQSPETIEKRVSQMRGIPRTEEYKARMRAMWTSERRAQQSEKLRLIRASKKQLDNR